jgi:hypothetical protein
MSNRKPQARPLFSTADDPATRGDQQNAVSERLSRFASCDAALYQNVFSRSMRAATPPMGAVDAESGNALVTSGNLNASH